MNSDCWLSYSPKFDAKWFKCLGRDSPSSTISSFLTGRFQICLRFLYFEKIVDFIFSPFSGAPNDRIVLDIYCFSPLLAHEPRPGRGGLGTARNGFPALHGGQDTLGITRPHAGKTRNPGSPWTLWQVSHRCYSTVTCKVLLNRPQHKLGQLCATRCSRLTRRTNRRCACLVLFCAILLL